jgi:hypothetical protein
MWRTLSLAAAVGLAAAAPAPARAGEAQDRLFAVGVLDAVPTGAHLLYRHERAGDFPPDTLAPVEGGEIDVALVAGDGGRREAEVRLTGRAGTPGVARLAAAAGHPVLIVFLENSARNMAALTGGNPVYIRNRMREALGRQDATEAVEIAVGGAPAAATAITFRPFADDPNRGRMAAFADLELRFVVSDAVPGSFARLEAEAGPGGGAAPAYLETMTFERLAEGE